MPGRKSEPVFASEDLEKLKKAKTPIVLKSEPRKTLRAVGNELAIISSSQQNGRPVNQQMVISSVSLDKKLFLTLPEAVAYSGLPRVYLEERIKDGGLKALHRGKYFISRRQFEDFKVW